MEDNEVELKDAKPGMWATFDITEPIDNSYGRVEPGHYEGAILEPTEGHLLEETVFSIFYGHDVVRLCIDGSTVGLERASLTRSSSSRTRNPLQALLRTSTSTRPNRAKILNLNHMRNFHVIIRDSILIRMVTHGVSMMLVTLGCSPMAICTFDTRVMVAFTGMPRSVRRSWWLHEFQS